MRILTFVAFVMLAFIASTYTTITNLKCPTAFVGDRVSQVDGVATVYDASTKVHKSQNVNLASGTTNIIYKSLNGNMQIQIRNNTDQSTKTVTLDFAEDFVFLDARQNFGLAKKIYINSTKVDFFVYYLSLSDQSSISHLGFSTNSETDSTGVNITTFKFVKILEVDAATNNVWLLLKDTTKTYVYRVTASLIKQGQIASINTDGGNRHLFYDKIQDKFYKTTSATALMNYVLTDPSTMFKTARRNKDDVRFFPLQKTACVIATVNATAGQLYMVYVNQFGTVYSEDFGGLATSSVKFFTDNFRAFVGVTGAGVFWLKANPIANSYEAQQSYTSTNTADQKIQILSDFNAATRISFSDTGNFLLTPDKIVVYTRFWSIAANSFTKTHSFILLDTFKTLLTGTTNYSIETVVKCTCSQKTLVSFNCMTSNYKCFALTSYTSQDCTTA